MSDRAENESLEECYPELAEYLAIFDPEHSEIYPPPEQKTGESAPDAQIVTVDRKSAWHAALILLVAALIVFFFIVIGITAIPGLEG